VCATYKCAIEKPRVLQSTYIRTVRVGGGRRMGCFCGRFYHHSGVFWGKSLVLLNKYTDNVSLDAQNRAVFDVFLYSERGSENLCTILNIKVIPYNGLKKYNSKICN